MGRVGAPTPTSNDEEENASQKHLFGFYSNRSDDDEEEEEEEEEEYVASPIGPRASHFSHVNGPVPLNASIENEYTAHKGHPGEDASVHIEDVGTESVDLENNGFLWLPPDPEDENEGLSFEFSPSPSNYQSILVYLSSRSMWQGTVCERPHLLHIKGNFDKPLGHFLRDHLFDQNYRCHSCEMPAEAHVQCYTHRQGTLTISVKKLPETLLRGERDGKVWMWHRCLKCPRANGFPPVNQRVVMSDAAWGLSFGKFLELSFSDHAAVSRVASCGHSLHRDCLQFYGCGEMVACFRYASINVHSVYLPPPKLGFKYESQEWVEKELTELTVRAEIFFSEVLNALPLLVEMQSGLCLLKSGMKNPESTRQIADLVGILHKEKSEFEESLLKILNPELRKCQPAIDILKLNRLRRQLVLQSYAWDDRLIHADGFETKYRPEFTLSEPVQERLGATEKLFDIYVPVKTGKSSATSDLTTADTKPDQNSDHGVSETCNNLHEVVRESTDVSDILDAAWSGENYTAIVITKSSSFSASEADKLSSIRVSEEDMCISNVSQLPPVLSAKGADNMEDTVSCLGMSFINFYQSLTKKFVRSAQQVERLGEHDPVCISSFRDIEQQHGARSLLPVGVDDTVVPIYDDEPTSIISYALASPEYLLQVCNAPERAKDAAVPMQSHDAGNLQGFHVLGETRLEPYQSLASGDESMLSLSCSHSSLPLNPLLDTKGLHAKVSFEDDGLLGKVKYNVTCYYARQFEALRKIWCPSEVDFIRSLSRCKKWGAKVGKSNVFFSQTLDERFIIKQVTKAELGSFTKFAPEYFKYLSESISSAAPTCLAKILGIYQVSTKHLKGGKEKKMDVLVMENLMYGRNLTQLYDLKGSSWLRFNPDSSGSNKVLLDQNLIEAMPTSPIFVGNKGKRLLERAVWNDTAFLASIGVTDYSLLVGVDEEKRELVVGIIDFMRQYTWDGHLESWIKSLGVFGGLKSASPTIVSPKQYKTRFRKAITAYLLVVPDQWSPPISVPNKSQTDLFEENSQKAQSTAPVE